MEFFIVLMEVFQYDINGRRNALLTCNHFTIFVCNLNFKKLGVLGGFKISITSLVPISQVER